LELEESHRHSAFGAFTAALFLTVKFDKQFTFAGICRFYAN
jgi:hypothetical protein